MSDYSFIYESDTNANNLQNQLLADLDNTSVATMIGANIVDANDAYNVTITYLEDESGSNDYEMVVAIEDDRQTVARSLYDGIVTEMSSPNNLTPTAISVSASSGTNTPGTWAGMVTMSPVAPQRCVSRANLLWCRRPTSPRSSRRWPPPRKRVRRR